MRSGIFRDIALFIAVLLFLLIVIPIISSIFKQLILLQLVILIIGTAVLAWVVQRVRRRDK
ncbi:MAG: hypothetical protein JSW16_08300 [Dehalococcoidales bacterium]|nr:MAG: hypothetical protein JSW16_08300 [Dehalococcoidales bacterium]